MSMLIPRYLIGLLVGVVAGLLFPGIPQWLPPACLAIVFLFNEVRARLGCGDRWDGYRVSSLALFEAVVVFFWFGILLATGVVGRFLAMVAELIS